jgi:hypothetical protein
VKNETILKYCNNKLNTKNITMKLLSQIISSVALLIPISVNAQVYNLDFEEWVDSVMVAEDSTDYCGFYAKNSKWGDVKNWTLLTGVAYRTSDAVQGNYALVINDWYAHKSGYAYLGERARLVYSQNSGDFECKSGCGVAIDIKPNKVTASYKAIKPDVNSSDTLAGKVEAYFTSYDTILSKRDTIGSGSIILPETDSNYKAFSFPITYTSDSLKPDSLIFILSFKVYSSPNWQEWSDTCNNFYVYFDNIKLGAGVGVNENEKVIKKQKGLLIHPNPFKYEFTLFNNSALNRQVSLFNSNGKLITTFSVSPYQKLRYQKANKLPAGSYFLKEQDLTYKIIKQ